MTAVMGRHRGRPDCGAPAIFVVGGVCNPLLKTGNSAQPGSSVAGELSQLGVTWVELSEL